MTLEQEMGMGFSFKKLGKRIRLRDVSIKNATKVAVKAAPLVSTAIAFVPGGGVASKILDSKVGRILSKASNSKVGKFVTKAANTKVGKFVVKNGGDFAKTALNDAANRTLNSSGSGASSGSDASAPGADPEMQNQFAPGADSEMQNQFAPGDPNPAQRETAERLKDDGTPKKDNTLLYGGIALGVLTLGVIAMKKNSN